MIFERHANLKYKYGNRTLVVEEYIRNQEKEDMIQDNLTLKEYKDPFKG